MNLEQKIQNWRREMGAAGILSREALDELESHLREDMDRTARAGAVAEDAFAAAAYRIGQPGAVRREFAAGSRPPLPNLLAASVAILGAGGIQFALHPAPHTTMPTILAGYLIGMWCLTAMFVGWACLPLAVVGQPMAAQRGGWGGLTSRAVGTRLRSALTRRTFVKWASVLHGPILVALFYLMWAGAYLTPETWEGKYMVAGDPKELPGTFIFFYLILLWVLLTPVAVALPLLRVGAALRRGDGSIFAPILQCAATLLMIVAAWLYLRGDPHHLLTWFKD